MTIIILSKIKFISVILLILFFSKINIDLEKKLNESHFCDKCIYDKKLKKSCSKCSINLIYKPIKIKSIEETIDEIIKKKKSISRFGDGEFSIIFNENIRFQKFNKNLKYKLLEVLNSKIKDLMIGIMNFEDLKIKPFWKEWFKRNKFRFRKLLNKDTIYYNSFISRFVTLFKNPTKNKYYISKIKSIWNNRNILIIEGEKTRMGIGNDLFNNTKSIKRIICPTINAFKAYYRILRYFKKNNIDRETLILIALGPTATVLSYELCKKGFQSLDLGHLDIQYEYFLKNVTHEIKISNKYVNEVSGGSLNISPVKDKNYYKQILVKFT